jgi:glycosyltransferase involved in cell wall biosynthesis
MSVQISAIVCTHNRSDYLRKALRSLVDQTLSREQYEIVVVDNASKDNTQEVLAEFAHVPNLHTFYEPEIGLSRARNTGWRNAQGTYLAYLDDDGIAAPNWLENILRVFETFEPMPGVLGGKSDPIWEAPPPDWLSDHFVSQLAIINWADKPIAINKEQWLPACNIAYPREFVEKVGGFREDLGRQGAKMRSGGEDYLQKQIESLGYKAIYHPEIVIGHHVSASRLVKSYFRRKRYWYGFSAAVLTYPAGQLSTPEQIWLSVKRIAWALPRGMMMFATPNPAAFFRRECQLYESLGYVTGLWKPDAEPA